MKLLLIVALLTTSSFGFSQSSINLFADTVHAPFLYGVASGDPEPTEVSIWTKYEDGNLDPQESILWEVSDDENFTNIIQSGLFVATPNEDYTVNIRLTGLNAYHNYWYRFEDAAGNSSVVGRTRTAPTGGQSDHMRMAVTSCSSLFSGYFNAYDNIANREDLDAVVHLGDYIYDFVDPDEQIRIPSIYPQTPTNMTEWRARQKQYLLDPDLRHMRQMHPLIVIWDNHDLEYDNPPAYGGGLQAFQEYIPHKVLDPNQPDKLWRTFRYGDVMDLIMTDAQVFQDQDIISNSDYSMWGNEQYAWIQDQLINSTATWKFVGQQKMMGGWSIAGFPSWFPINGQYLDDSEWDGHDVARDRFLDYISTNNIDNVVVLSGDMHVSMSTDLCEDPYGSGYNGNTGSGSVAVEFLPASISRGNINELLGSSFLAGIIAGLSAAVNPNHVYAELEQHGYGILDVKPDSVVAEYWYCDVLNDNPAEAFAAGTIVKDGVNHWERQYSTSATAPKVIPVNPPNDASVEALSEDLLRVYPNPSSGLIQVYSPSKIESIKVFNAMGKVVHEWTGNSNGVQLNIAQSGIYLVLAECSGVSSSKKVMVY